MGASTAPLVWPHGPHTLVGSTIGADGVAYQCACGFTTLALPTPQHAFFDYQEHAYQEHCRAVIALVSLTPPLGGGS